MSARGQEPMDDVLGRGFGAWDVGVERRSKAAKPTTMMRLSIGEL